MSANSQHTASAHGELHCVTVDFSSGGKPADRTPGAAMAKRLDATDWTRIENELDVRGSAVLSGLLTADECAAVAGYYDDPARFRRRIVMSQHGFGRGEYQYFTYPLPPIVAELRGELYSRLAAVATRWNETLRIAARYPRSHDEFLLRCHAAGQVLPTPLLLKYAPDDYNCLHQDLYGEHVFPLQVAILLSAPGRDFTGGEFVLTEQRPRMQSRAQIIPLSRGDAAIFAVHHRPAHGTRGVYRVNLRHGVSRLRSGKRYTLGVIFHDAA